MPLSIFLCTSACRNVPITCFSLNNSVATKIHRLALSNTFQNTTPLTKTNGTNFFIFKIFIFSRYFSLYLVPPVSGVAQVIGFSASLNADNPCPNNCNGLIGNNCTNGVCLCASGYVTQDCSMCMKKEIRIFLFFSLFWFGKWPKLDFLRPYNFPIAVAILPTWNFPTFPIFDFKCHSW